MEGIGPNVEEDSVHIHKLLGEVQFHFYISLSCHLQNVWALICGNLLRQKLQRLYVSEKVSKAAKSVWKQTLRKQLSIGVGRGKSFH